MATEIILQNRYHIRHKIGRGASAATFLAHDERTNEACVVKQFSLHGAEDWKAIELFEREAKLLKYLNHPNIPRYIDYFTVEDEHNVYFYLVQEYVTGKSLQDLVEEGRHFTEQEAKDIVEAVAGILVYLQQFSPPIVHRDIKPGNIILTNDSQVYLIDFGSARDRIHAEGNLTITGTFGYMAPEQARGNAVPASDIFSLGMTIIYLLSHISPNEMDEQDFRIQFHKYVNISRNFIQFLEKMVEPGLNDRFRDASELVRALQAPSRPLPKRRKAQNRKRRYPLLVGIAALLLFGGIGSLGFLFFQSTPQTQTATPEQREELQEAYARYRRSESSSQARTTASDQEDQEGWLIDEAPPSDFCPSPNVSAMTSGLHYPNFDTCEEAKQAAEASLKSYHYFKPCHELFQEDTEVLAVRLVRCGMTKDVWSGGGDEKGTVVEMAVCCGRN